MTRNVSLPVAVVALLLSLLSTTTALAANCNGAVVRNVLASSIQCQDGSFAYKTDKSTVWICVATSGAGMNAARVQALNDIVLAAFLSGRTVNYDLTTSGCSGSTSWTSGTTVFYME